MPERPEATPVYTPTPTPQPTAAPSQQPTPAPSPTVVLPAEPSPKPTPVPTISPEFVELIELYGNEDIVGYLNIKGTSVDYIVLQYDDNDFYLHHDINKDADETGWIFLDYENDVLLQDYNSII